MTHVTAMLAVLTILLTAVGATAGTGRIGVYIGTDGHDPHHGIYRLELDPATGRFTGPPVLVVGANAPEFLAISADGNHLYASDATPGKEPRPKDGRVDTYAVAGDGSLKLLGGQPCGGDRGTHILLDSAGKNLFSVAYGAATVAVLPVGPDGALQAPTVVVKHTGSSVNKSRQSEAHPHTITLDPAGRFAFVPDLGADKVVIYRVDAEAHTLVANDPAFVSTPPGSGPRRICFSRDGHFAYAMTEMANTVLIYKYDAERGVLTEEQEVPILPKPAPANNTGGAEIALGAGDKYLYVSTRGRDEIDVLRRDAVAGTVEQVSAQSTLGKTPRHFAIDPTGKWLIAGNQHSATVKVFGIDPATGALSPTGGSADIESPTCVLFDRDRP